MKKILTKEAIKKRMKSISKRLEGDLTIRQNGYYSGYFEALVYIKNTYQLSPSPEAE